MEEKAKKIIPFIVEKNKTSSNDAIIALIKNQELRTWAEQNKGKINNLINQAKKGPATPVGSEKKNPPQQPRVEQNQNQNQNQRQNEEFARNVAERRRMLEMHSSIPAPRLMLGATRIPNVGFPSANSQIIIGGIPYLGENQIPTTSSTQMTSGTFPAPQNLPKNVNDFIEKLKSGVSTDKSENVPFDKLPPPYVVYGKDAKLIKPNSIPQGETSLIIFRDAEDIFLNNAKNFFNIGIKSRIKNVIIQKIVDVQINPTYKIERENLINRLAIKTAIYMLAKGIHIWADFIYTFKKYAYFILILVNRIIGINELKNFHLITIENIPFEFFDVSYSGYNEITKRMYTTLISHPRSIYLSVSFNGIKFDRNIFYTSDKLLDYSKIKIDQAKKFSKNLFIPLFFPNLSNEESKYNYILRYFAFYATNGAMYPEGASIYNNKEMNELFKFWESVRETMEKNYKQSPLVVKSGIFIGNTPFPETLNEF